MKNVTYDPDKWQLAPKEPTPEMRLAAESVRLDVAEDEWEHLTGDEGKDVFRAMLNAAPTPPATSADWEATWFSSVECALAEDCYVKGDLAASLLNLANRARKPATSDGEAVKELMEALRGIKNNLMHNRLHGQGTLQSWRKAAVRAEGDIEDAIAKWEGK